jgi:hypothetical protein
MLCYPCPLKGEMPQSRPRLFRCVDRLWWSFLIYSPDYFFVIQAAIYLRYALCVSSFFNRALRIMTTPPDRCLTSPAAASRLAMSRSRRSASRPSRSRATHSVQAGLNIAIARQTVIRTPGRQWSANSRSVRCLVGMMGELKPCVAGDKMLQGGDSRARRWYALILLVGAPIAAQGRAGGSPLTVSPMASGISWTSLLMRRLP